MPRGRAKAVDTVRRWVRLNGRVAILAILAEVEGKRRTNAIRPPSADTWTDERRAALAATMRAFHAAKRKMPGPPAK